MSDYDFNKESLRPNKVYGDINSPTINKKYNKATTERSKSKQKLIVTSFSKKQITDRNINQQQLANSALRKHQITDINSPNSKKSQCQSEYYFKTAETKQDVDQLHFQDQIRVKESQLQILATRLAKAEFQIKQLTTENQLKAQRIDSLEKELSNLLTKTLKQLQNQNIGVDLSYQCQKYKQDQRRLLKMLEQTAQYVYFSKFATLDDGIKFLRHPNQIKKSHLDATNAKKPMHYCSCNKQFISQSSFWVPQKIYSFGREFIKERNGQFTKSQYQLLLYELNKMWRERQKRIVNTLNGEKVREIQKIKRKRQSFTSLQKSPINK